MLFGNNENMLCIDIGYKNIKIVELTKNSNMKISVDKFGIGKTPPDSIANGSINRTDILVNSIRKIIAEHKMKSKSAKIIVSGTNIITRLLEVKKVEGEDPSVTIKKSINFLMPFVDKDYKVDYRMLQVQNSIQDDSSFKVFAIAVPKLILESYIKLLNGLGLKPLAIDIPGNSAAKFCARISDKESISHNTIAYVDFGSETTIVNILQNGTLTYSKPILSGSSNIDDMLMKNLHVDANEAEKMKLLFGLDKPNIDSTQEHIDVYNLIFSHVTDLILDIHSCFEDFSNSFENTKVSKMFITGGGSQLLGLEHRLSSLLNIPVCPVTSLQLNDVTINKKIDKQKLTFMANSLGISL